MSGRDGIVMVVLMAVFVAGLLAGIAVEGYEFQHRAVKAGVAQFNPKTATFEWLTPDERVNAVR